MIEVKTTVIGDKEIAQKFAEADPYVRDAIREGLEEIGTYIVEDARARAPRASGILARKIQYAFGRERGKQRTFREDPDALRLTVWPGGRVAHLMERGVNATVTRGRRRRELNVYDVRGRGRRARRTLVAEGVDWGRKPIKPYHLRIAPRPFFEPAVQGIGGGEGALASLQRVLDEAIAKYDQGGA
jgi:hypothetical protein